LTEVTVMKIFERYHWDMESARQRIEALEPRTVETPFGRVEYVERGEGPPVLVVHGITQGADGGVYELAEGLVPSRYRLLVPSRFGYLGSEMPEGATPEMQADAFDALLEAIGEEDTVVLAGSAGSTSALHLAVRHPDRVRGLILVSANVPGIHQSKGLPPKPVFRAIFSSDPILWLIVTYLPGVMASLSQVLRVPRSVRPSPEDLALIARAMHGVFPGKLRATGAVFDAYVSNPDINRIELSDVPVPTLIMHALDDPGPPYAAAARMARQIPIAKLVTVQSGGHLMLGEHPSAIDEVHAFLREFSAVPSEV
jgi:pimeloyl-ACP methyl ester carboxylesterase